MIDIFFEYVRKWIYRNIRRPSDVYSSISPIITTCFYLGLSPYVVEVSSDKRKTIRYSNWANFFTFTIVSISVGLIIWNSHLDGSDDNQDFKQKLMYYQEMAACVLSLCGILVLCLYSKKLMAVFPIIYEIDESMKALLVWMDHRETYVRALLAVIMMTVYIICGAIWLILEWTKQVNPFFCRDNRPSDVVKFMIPYYITIIMELLYGRYLSLLRSRFQLLNNYLKTLIPKKKTAFNGWTTTNISKSKRIFIEDTDLAKKISKALDPAFVVDHIATLHLKLTDAAHIINRAFALQQLFKIAITFVSIVSALYFLAIYFSNPETRTLDFLFVIWALSNALEALGIVYVTSETCEEANTCPRILHKIRNNSDNEVLQDTIEIYSLQMYHNRLVFNVMGLFPLDYSLLYTMTAGITTYLVILIQFNPKDFSPDSNDTVLLSQASGI